MALLFRGEDGIAQHLPEIGGHQPLMFRDLLHLHVFQFLLQTFLCPAAISGHVQLVGHFQLFVGRTFVRAPEIQGIVILPGDYEVKLIIGDQRFVGATQIKKFFQVVFFHV